MSTDQKLSLDQERERELRRALRRARGPIPDNVKNDPQLRQKWTTGESLANGGPGTVTAEDFLTPEQLAKVP